MQLSNQCQRKVFTNLMCHPVYLSHNFSKFCPFIVTLNMRRKSDMYRNKSFILK